MLADFTAPAYGVDNLDIDFGFVEQFDLCGAAWEDVDGDGRREASEPRIAGVEVQLYVSGNTGGAPLATMVTPTNGSYCFNSLNDALVGGETYVLRINRNQAPLLDTVPAPTSPSIPPS